VIADAHGDLFGTTREGGVPPGLADGTVFEIAKTATGYASTPTTLVSFNHTNGSQPVASLIADAHGDLFGTTREGGVPPGLADGTVFEIAKTATGYASTHTTLVTFTGDSHGGAPYGSLIADAHGDLFGTTSGGGAPGPGTVFEIAKTANASTPTTLVSFNGTNGASPVGSLIADAHGDLFGTTSGGGVNNDGTVFEIAKTAHGYASSHTTLVSFNGANGAGPQGSLIADAHGDLFGTTSVGGANGNGPFDSGTVFEIAKTATGYASTPITLVSFNVTNGAEPTGSLIADAHGDLFGTTANGGANGDSILSGTVFEITGSGFIPPTTTIIRGNDDNISVFADNTIGYTIIIGNGSNDFVSADFSSQDKITLGNGADDTVSAFLSSNDTITLGNGDRDTVYADCSNHDTITLGNGAGDRVDADTDNFGLISSYDTITLGNGAGDPVDANSSNHDRITLGNGAADTVSANLSSYDTINIGNGQRDTVNAGTSYDDIITLGNGAGDAVNAGDNRYDRITLGNGAGDKVNADGSFDDDILTLGNGAADAVSADLSSYAKIALGNGINDFVSADNSSLDTIVLGNGAGNKVSANYSSYDTVIVGNGAGDTVAAGNNPNDTVTGEYYNTITLGDGAGDTVNVLRSFLGTITLGNGAGDTVGANNSNDKITLGDGAGDGVTGRRFRRNNYTWQWRS
jgi:uncharacterized repeat protein (TIGR03803 family)